MSPALMGAALLAAALGAEAASVVIPAGATVSIPSGSLNLACGDLTVQGTMTTGASLVSGIGNVSIAASATLDGGAGTLTVGGNWANSGTFAPGTSTIVFADGCSTAPAQLTGTTGFANLTFSSAVGRTFVIPSGSALSVAGMLVLSGTAAAPIQVVASDPAASAVIVLGPLATQSSTYAQLGSNVAIGAPVVPARLGNISTRGMVLTGDNVMIGGFVIGGSAPKTVLVRARGPSLASAGVAGAMANPRLTLVDQAAFAVIATNDDWGSAPNVSAITATGNAPTNAVESAILISLNPGAYTAIVDGSGGGTGVGIVEVFEVDHPEVPLVNISTRGLVLTGDSVMIGGFVVSGDVPKTVLVRARGPSLASAGVVGAMANPRLTLVNQATFTVIGTNDDFGTSSNLTQILATGQAPTNVLESAILITLNPGAYTAIVDGVGGATGVGIVEVFAQ